MVGIVAAAAILGAGCTGEDDPSTPPAPVAEPGPCPPDVELVVLAPHDCGFLTVPEDRSRPDGPSVRLFYLHVEPVGSEPLPEPIATVGYEVGQTPAYSSVVVIAQNSSRELYVLDQRGTGYSEPSLACTEVDARASELVAEPLAAAEEAFIEAVTACRERLESSGVRLAAYSLPASAQDLEDLRGALGIPTWDLISWGSASRVLLEYVRRHPDDAGAVVLSEGVQFPERDPISGAVSAFRDAFEALAQACGADDPCRRRYPDLSRALAEAVAALDEAPMTETVDGSPVVVDGAGLLRVVRYFLSDRDLHRWAEIPRLVYAALDGDVSEVAGALALDPGMCVGYLIRCQYPISLGAYLSAICPGVVIPDDQPAPYASAFGSIDPYVRACAAWGIEPDAAAREPVAADVPTLVLIGQFDSFSPREVVQSVGTVMPGARIAFLPQIGDDDPGSVQCVRLARNDWMVHPEGEPDFDECLQAVPPLEFATSTPADADGGSPAAAAELTGPTETSGAADPLEGTWSTPVMSKADHIRAAREAGCPPEVIDAFHDWPVDAVHTLTFKDGQWVESLTEGDGAPEVGSLGTYAPPSDGMLVLDEPAPYLGLTFDMQLDGDVLTLRLRDWECHEPGSLEGDIAQSFIFQGAPFTRES
jgi:pimeloyl-ACP methyl ester carboxylesterase